MNVIVDGFEGCFGVVNLFYFCNYDFFVFEYEDDDVWFVEVVDEFGELFGFVFDGFEIEVDS